MRRLRGGGSNGKRAIHFSAVNPQCGQRFEGLFRVAWHPGQWNLPGLKISSGSNIKNGGFPTFYLMFPDLSVKLEISATKGMCMVSMVI